MDNTLQQWEKDNKKNLNPPFIAWPTVLLFMTASIIFFLSSYLTIQNEIPFILGFGLNAIAQFLCFTVLHDASHRAVAQHETLNELIGTVAAYILNPFAGIKIFRFIHMQHHRFTNEGEDVDPDEYCGRGYFLFLPLRWMTVDLHYTFWYSKRWSTRPSKEKQSFVATIVFSLLLISLLTALGYGYWVLFLYILSGRIAMAMLACTFDFLPHFPYDTKESENPMRATCIRPNMSWLATPVLLSQNYHLIHHLYPRIPFYRYPWVWIVAKKELADAGARIMDWKNNEITDPTKPSNDRHQQASEGSPV